MPNQIPQSAVFATILAERLAAHNAAKAGRRELAQRLGLQIAMDMDEKRADRKQRMEELQIRYGEERQARADADANRVLLQGMSDATLKAIKDIEVGQRQWEATFEATHRAEKQPSGVEVTEGGEPGAILQDVFGTFEKKVGRAEQIKDASDALDLKIKTWQGASARLQKSLAASNDPDYGIMQGVDASGVLPEQRADAYRKILFDPKLQQESQDVLGLNEVYSANKGKVLGRMTGLPEQQARAVADSFYTALFGGAKNAPVVPTGQIGPVRPVVPLSPEEEEERQELIKQARNWGF